MHHTKTAFANITGTQMTSGANDSQADDPREAERLGDLSRQQWRSGIAAWLGWTFDGLEMHLYTLVAAPFVAELLQVDVAGGERRLFTAP